jgi:hypothetical protein
MMLMAPSMACEPYTTEPGPSITSMRSIISMGMPAPRSK